MCAFAGGWYFWRWWWADPDEAGRRVMSGKTVRSHNGDRGEHQHHRDGRTRGGIEDARSLMRPLLVSDVPEAQI